MATTKTITQRIAFEGGAQMELQLKQLGDAGTTAFTRIKEAADNASGFGAKMTAAVEAVRVRLEGLAESGANLKEKLSGLGEAVKTTAERLVIAATAAAGAAVGFAALVLKAANAADEVGKASESAGIGAKQFQNLKAALGLVGVGGDEVSGLLNKMNKSLGESVKASLDLEKKQTDLRNEYLKGKLATGDYLQKQQDLNKEARESITVFNRLGVSAATALNDPHEALLQFADAFKDMPAGIEKSSLELEVFGKRGTKMASALQEGREGILALEKEAQRIAPAFTPAEIAIGTKLHDSFEKLTLAAENTSNHFFLLFGPPLQRVFDAVTEVIVNNRDKLIEFGNLLVNKLRPILADIIHLMEGQDIPADSFVAKARDQIIAFATAATQAIGIVVAAWEGFVAILNTVANAINAVFGTKLTGQALAIVAVIGVMTGAFSALAALISTIVAVIGVLDAVLLLAFGPEGALLVGLALMGAAIGALIVQIPSVKDAFQALVDGFNGTVANFVTLFQLIGAAWQLLWQEAGNVVRSALGGVLDLVQSVIDKINAAISAVKNFFTASSGDSNSGQGYATGGKVNGPGSSRSDSILARLSNGEFVHQVPAVQYYGERFMHAINNMQIPRSLVSGIAGFANGGMARAASALAPGLPGYAFGGLVQPGDLAASTSGGRPFILQIGDEVFTGLRAEDKTADKLSRFATRRSVHSAGRRPAWET